MGSVNIRRGYTSGGYCVLSPWNDAGYSYCILQLNIGYNPISKLEIVSALNSFNLAVAMFYHRYDNRTAKYNPKAYLGAVQTFAGQWNSELGKLGEGNPGSGSCFNFYYLSIAFKIISFAIAGLALPRLAFITCPTI